MKSFACQIDVICKYDILYGTHTHVFGKSLEAKKKQKTNVGFGIIFVFYPSCYLTVTAAGCAAVTPSRVSVCLPDRRLHCISSLND